MEGGTVILPRTSVVACPDLCAANRAKSGEM